MEENSSIKNKNWKKIIYDFIYVLISIGIIIYLIYIVNPIAEQGDFLNEGRSPNPGLINQYKLMIIPVFIFYLIYSGLEMDVVHKKMKILVYPITILEFIILLFYLLSIGGGSSIWGLFLLIPLLPVLLFIWFKLVSIIKKAILNNNN